MEGYEQVERSMDAIEARGPGSVDRLKDQVERLHHQIGLIAEQLSPVLRMDEPRTEQALKEASFSALDEQVALVAEAVERIIRVRDRLVV